MIDVSPRSDLDRGQGGAGGGQGGHVGRGQGQLGHRLARRLVRGPEDGSAVRRLMLTWRLLRRSLENAFG